MNIFNRIKTILRRAKIRRQSGTALDILVTDIDGEKTFAPVISIPSFWGFSVRLVGVKKFEDIGWVSLGHGIILGVKSPEFATQDEATKYGTEYLIWLQEQEEADSRQKRKKQYLLSDAPQS